MSQQQLQRPILKLELPCCAATVEHGKRRATGACCSGAALAAWTPLRKKLLLVPPKMYCRDLLLVNTVQDFT
eukprot:3197828-Rhodomonas_salina.2